jgi:hypothetical protein
MDLASVDRYSFIFYIKNVSMLLNYNDGNDTFFYFFLSRCVTKARSSFICKVINKRFESIEGAGTTHSCDTVVFLSADGYT